MSWNYRIVKRLDGTYALHEVYYDENGKPWSMTENPTIFVADNDEGPADIREALEMAMKRDVFIEPKSMSWPGVSPGPNPDATYQKCVDTCAAELEEALAANPKKWNKRPDGKWGPIQ